MKVINNYVCISTVSYAHVCTYIVLREVRRIVNLKIEFFSCSKNMKQLLSTFHNLGFSKLTRKLEGIMQKEKYDGVQTRCIINKQVYIHYLLGVIYKSFV